MNNKVLEQLKEEYNETLNRMQDLGDILAHCAEMDTSHCGQDAKEEAHVSLNELLGMKVICVGGSAMKCKDCSWNCDNCVKVELIGGDYICLAEPEQEESTTEIDDSPKSFEEAYCDSMNLLREFCIKQGEANQRLVEALKEEREKLKKPVISFDDEKNEDIGDIMAEIKERADDFMNYLDSIVKPNGNDEQV